MANVSAYTTRTGKRVRSYQRGAGVTRRLRTGVALDHAVRQMARGSWGGGSAFGSSPGSYRSHLAHTARVASPEFTRGSKRISRAEVASAARKARYSGSVSQKVHFLALNAERRRRVNTRRRGGTKVATLQKKYPHLTSMQIKADLARYGKVASWR